MKEWKFSRYSLFIEFTNTSTTPPPVNLLLLPVEYPCLFIGYSFSLMFVMGLRSLYQWKVGASKISSDVNQLHAKGSEGNVNSNDKSKTPEDLEVDIKKKVMQTMAKFKEAEAGQERNTISYH